MLQVGDQLPTIKEVVALVAVNPNTVAKAYRELELEGLVEGRAGVGTFVTRSLAGPSLAAHGDLRRKLLVWFVAADAFLLFTEVMTTYVSGEPDHREQLDILLTGRLAPVFWAEISLGLLLPAALLVSRLGRRPNLIAASSLLLLLGVFAKRINILFAAEFQPLVGERS